MHASRSTLRLTLEQIQMIHVNLIARCHRFQRAIKEIREVNRLRLTLELRSTGIVGFFLCTFISQSENHGIVVILLVERNRQIDVIVELEVRSQSRTRKIWERLVKTKLGATWWFNGWWMRALYFLQRVIMTTTNVIYLIRTVA